MKNLAGKREHTELLDHLEKDDLRIVTWGLSWSNLERHAGFADSIRKSNVVANFDNDKNKWGIGGPAETFSPDRIIDFISKADAVIIMSASIEEIGEQLERLGVKQFFAADLLDACVVEFDADKVDRARGLLSDRRSIEVFNVIFAARQSMEMQERARLFASVYSDDQYFPTDIPSYSFSTNEVFVDAGSYIGDTIEVFLEKTKSQYRHIYAFEPDAQNFLKLAAFCKNKNDISLYQTGLYSHNAALRFSEAGNASSCLVLDEKNQNSEFVCLSTLELRSLDDVVDKPVSFIKMDIEGAELDALHGAERSIIASQPKLAICVYHKISDFWEIPLYLKKIVPTYQLYIRHHSIHLGETVLYAIPS